MPVTVKYENIPKSEIRKKEMEKIGIAKKKATRRGKYIQKEKSIHGKKNKKPLKTRNKTPAFLAATSNKEDSTC